MDAPDPPEVLSKLAGIKVPWDQDVEYYFFEIENQMEIQGIRSQLLKRCVLANNIPPLIKAEVKDLLKKPKAQAGNLIYKEVKLKIVKLFGKKEGELFQEAKQLMMTGKPSALAKTLVDKLCKCNSATCCSTETISGLWKDQLPSQVKASIAGLTIRDNFEEIIARADKVRASLGGAPKVSAVAAPGAGEEEEVTAVRPGPQHQRGRGQQRGRGNQRAQGRGGRGWGAGRGQQPQHNDNVPDTACKMHKMWGKGTWYCTQPWSCPWKDITTTPPPK